jgi:PHD/YefM family antitoxin component YafN of YafNO toxin-antitoxin module
MAVGFLHSRAIVLLCMAAAFQRNFGRYQDEALKQPLSITRNGRDRLVVLAAAKYQRLKRRDRVARKTEDLSAAEREAIANTETDRRHNHLNALRSSQSRRSCRRMTRSCRSISA